MSKQRWWYGWCISINVYMYIHRCKHEDKGDGRHMTRLSHDDRAGAWQGRVWFSAISSSIISYRIISVSRPGPSLPSSPPLRPAPARHARGP